MKSAVIHKPLIKNIAFFGDSEIPENGKVYQDAFETAKLLAEKGFTIVNGGGPGIMNASTKGAQAVNGETLSVTFYPKDAPGFEGRYLGNITNVEIKTGNYIERMFKLMEHADLFIIFKGGTGTISELGTAWVLAKLYYGHHKPFILFGEFWYPIIDSIKENLNIDKNELDVFVIVDKIEDVLPAIEHFEWKLKQVDHSHCKVCGEKAFMT
ncbi:MAG: LOG family protein [Patescibacteria group bacterium]